MTREQALETAACAAIAALSQNATFPADIAAAKKWLSDALNIPMPSKTFNPPAQA